MLLATLTALLARDILVLFHSIEGTLTLALAQLLLMEFRVRTFGRRSSLNLLDLIQRNRRFDTSNLGECSSLREFILLRFPRDRI